MLKTLMLIAKQKFFYIFIVQPKKKPSEFIQGLSLFRIFFFYPFKIFLAITNF